MSTEEKKSVDKSAESSADKSKSVVHPIKGIMDTTLSKIKDMVDVSTIIGDPIVSGGATIIPISKLSYGFASGGSDFDGKAGHRCFGGGGGAGVSVNPVAFLVINGGNVRLIQIDEHMNSLDKAVGMIPNLVDKVSDLLAGVKKDKNQDPEISSEKAEMAEPLTTDEKIAEE